MVAEQLRRMPLFAPAEQSSAGTTLPSAHADELPKIAAKADDLEEIKKTVEDAAAVSGGLWLSYLFVLFYLAIAAGAVTHTDLLLENRVRLPFLNIDLPLRAFFLLAPFLFLVVHAYALVHFNMLGRKAKRFHDELQRQLPDEDLRDKLRLQLPSNIFVQTLAGPPELRAGIFGAILKLIAWTTLVFFPVLLLLLLQIQFLPYHDLAITWAQRAALLLDILLLWILRPPALPRRIGKWTLRRNEGCDAGESAAVQAWRLSCAAVAALLSLAAIWLSVVIATVPREWQEAALAKLDPAWWRSVSENLAGTKIVKLISMREFLFTGPVDETTRRRRSWFSNTLVLPGFNLYEALNVDDPKKLDWKDHLIDLRGRHLEEAMLDDATLLKADLTGAHLEGAFLNRTQLQGTSLDYAHLQGASLDNAGLEGASLENAWLQGASLIQARLQATMLDGAKLQGATMVEAKIQGASLKLAALQGAWLELAQLQGAALVKDQLQGAWLAQANIAAADFSGSELWRIETVGIEGDKNAPINLEGARPYPEDGSRQPWSEKSYDALKRSLEDIPGADLRRNALSRIARLDCEDKTLTSCEYGRASNSVPEAIQNLLEFENSNLSFEDGLANTLQKLICSDSADAIYILRGLMNNGRLAETGGALVDTIDSPKCPVSALLTLEDRSRLRALRDSSLSSNE